MIQDHLGRYLIEQRTSSLLKGMWQFPMVEQLSQTPSEAVIVDSLKIKEKEIMTLKHQFTHLTWKLHVHLAEIAQEDERKVAEGRLWLVPEQKEHYSFPVPMTKIFKKLHQAE